MINNGHNIGYLKKIFDRAVSERIVNSNSNIVEVSKAIKIFMQASSIILILSQWKIPFKIIRKLYNNVRFSHLARKAIKHSENKYEPEQSEVKS